MDLLDDSSAALRVPASTPAPGSVRGARRGHLLRVLLREAVGRLDGAHAAAGVATAAHDDLVTALDDLAHRVADVEHAWAARAVLVEVVTHLERRAGAAAAAPSTDPVVVLQRRFDHAHRLLREDPRGLTAADVRFLQLRFDAPAGS